MVKNIDYCRSGTSWNITNGKNINLWTDKWIANNLSLRNLIHGPIPKHELYIPVAQLISHSTWYTSNLSFLLPLRSYPSFKTPPSLQPNKEMIHPTGTTLTMDHLPLPQPIYIYYTKTTPVK
ncbi:hypothetical protein A4A49_18171 [Nicotiana attenuata]|uniref:Uncharacterized protein n=1 Tax=Nicotiana attenuata TaxID=49451 RepID=A0A1J6JNU6_NICAT|nr:hypothetical protein A4A49_18171 [Nicotiana attenuata]